jgi:hypothetical protein
MFIQRNLMTAGAFRTPFLARFPGAVFQREADAAGPVTRGTRMALVEEENAMRDITAARNRAQRGGTVEATVDAGASVAAESPSPTTRIRPAVGPEQLPSHKREVWRIGCKKRTGDVRGFPLA